MKTLIPGLPEEIGLECLIRVPPQSLPVLRRVCRRWKEAAESPLFQRLRRSAGSSQHLLIFAQAQPSPPSSPALKFPPSFRLSALHPSSGEWSPLPSLPFRLPLFCGLAASSLHLTIIGGWNPDTFAPSTTVYIYSFLSAAWRRGRPMPAPARSFFACAAGPRNQVFVAGGHDADKNALKSALVYDIAEDEWAALPDMARERDECAGVFVADAERAGLFHVLGGYCTSMQGRFERSAEAFDVGERRWRAVEEEAVPEGEEGRVVYACGGGGKVVAVTEGRELPELPEDVRVAARVVGWAGGLLVLGTGTAGGAQKACVLEIRRGAPLGWRRVDMPKEYSGYVQSACCVEV